MLTSSRDTFTDPGAFRDALRSADVEILLPQRGDFRVEFTRVDLNAVSLQSGRESLPRVGRGAVSAKRTAIYFLLGSGQARGVHSGVDLSPGEIVVNSAGSTYHHRTSANCHWADLSLSPDDLAAAASALTGHELEPHNSSRILRPRPIEMMRLVNLHKAAAGLTKVAQDRLAQSEVARSMEHAVTHATIACLVDQQADEQRVFNSRHKKLLARFEELLAERGYAPLYLAEICAEIGVPERTLRALCQRHLGMGPIRYLWLRRMHLAHRALVRAEADSTSVASVATDQGFWELGKFSVAYRALFGESPSATLCRRGVDPSPPKGSPFGLRSAVSA